MGRHRQFDTDEALHAAMETFWEHGYEGTSLLDLLQETGLSRGSFYKAFGSKRSVYLHVLRRYLAAGREKLRARLERSPVLPELEAKLRATASDATSGARRGCFAVSAANEVAPADDEVRALLAEHAREVDGIMADAVRRGVEHGEFAPSVDPVAVALAMRMWIAGTQVYGKIGLSSDEANATVDALLGLLPKKM